MTYGNTYSTTHKQTYYSWRNMMQRCYAKMHPAYHMYGARGITVTERWHTYANFFEDMGVKPAGLELDRIDNDGDYSKENCRWATRLQQVRNRRKTRTFTYKGETKTIQEWADQLNMTYNTLYARIHKNGWPVPELL